MSGETIFGPTEVTVYYISLLINQYLSIDTDRSHLAYQLQIENVGAEGG